ncbi:MAG: flagellar protein FlgN [Gammaproteobacteria bacterium]|nr:flagellar protein FlgN [Gammaproteobacteria bacterium]
MNDRQHYRNQLHDLLRTQFDCAGRLHTVLTAEAEALTNRDVDSLERLVGDKHGLIQTFEALELRKRHILDQTGFGADQDVEACIDWCDDSGQLRRGWHLLLERINRCQRQNRINGATLDSSRRHAQQALAILRGQPIAAQLYNPAGATTLNEDSGRSLAKA